jgi:hypothetical protein
MAAFTPSVVPLGSLAEAAAASAQLSQQEAQIYGWDSGEPGTLTGAVGPQMPTWP